jgi:transcriptional regulator with XRE-family HTH domain
VTPDELRAARKAKGWSQADLAQALRMGSYGWQIVGRWEKGGTIPGPAQIALEAVLRSEK